MYFSEICCKLPVVSGHIDIHMKLQDIVWGQEQFFFGPDVIQSCMFHMCVFFLSSGLCTLYKQSVSRKISPKLTLFE